MSARQSFRVWFWFLKLSGLEALGFGLFWGPGFRVKDEPGQLLTEAPSSIIVRF